MKHYMVVAQNPSVQQQNAIYNNIVKDRYAFWHWFTNVWLLTDSWDQDSVEGLRDKITEVVPELTFYVFEVQPVTWAGFSSPTWFDWLNENWKSY